MQRISDGAGHQVRGAAAIFSTVPIPNSAFFGNGLATTHLRFNRLFVKHGVKHNTVVFYSYHYARHSRFAVGLATQQSLFFRTNLLTTKRH